MSRARSAPASALAIPMTGSAKIALLGAILVAAPLLFFFPSRPDGDYVTLDPALYRQRCRAGNRPLASGLGSDLLARALGTTARRLGVPRPWERAYRLVGASATGLCFGALLAAWSRRSRRRDLSALAIPLGASVVWIAGGLGEIIPLGTGLALLTLAAAGSGASLRLLVPLLALATVARQDNILLLPALALLVGHGGSPRARAGRFARLLAPAGALSLAVYALVWVLFPCAPTAIDPASTFRGWLLGTSLANGGFGAFSPGEAGDPVILLRAAAESVFGHEIPDRPASPPLLGLAVILSPLLLCWPRARARLPRGRAPELGAHLAAAGTFIAFYLWFEPGNPERWHPVLFFVTQGVLLRDRVKESAAPKLRPRGLHLLVPALLLVAGAGGIAGSLPESRTLRATSMRDAADAARRWAEDHPGTQPVVFNAPATHALREAGFEPPILLFDPRLEITASVGVLDPDRPALFYAATPALRGHIGSPWRDLILERCRSFPPLPGVRAHRSAGGELLFVTFTP